MNNKYLKAHSYFQFIKRKYVEVFYPNVKSSDKLVEEQISLFRSLKLDYRGGLSKLNEILGKNGLGSYDENNGMMSQHWVAFAAISLVFEPKNILEIGTFNGRSTFVLSKIFPNSMIDTVELPDDSPHFVGSYNRDIEAVMQKQVAERSEFLAKCPNVKLNQTNSFNLGRLFESKNFDLIWIDGEHGYPVVAWDLFYGFTALNSGGWLMADDFYLHPKSHLLATYNESYEAVNYLTVDQSIHPTYVHKRIHRRENIVKHKHILLVNV